MTSFSENDRRLIEALCHDTKATPALEALKGCLVWTDEVPDGLSNTGHELLNDLLAARGMMHLGQQLQDLPRAYRDAWTNAVESKLKWPGFARLRLLNIGPEVSSG